MFGVRSGRFDGWVRVGTEVGGNMESGKRGGGVYCKPRAIRKICSSDFTCIFGCV